MNINLHIERLVLDGVSVAPGQGYLLQSIVVTELTRMLTDGGVSSGLAKGAALPRIAAGKIQFNDSNNSTQLGQQIAQSVYGGIGHE